MNTKLFLKFFVISGMALSGSLMVTSEQNRNGHQSLSMGIPFARGIMIANCDSIVQNAVTGEPDDGTYTNHMLNHVHRQLYRFNKMESADIELIFCKMVHGLGMNPDVSDLTNNPVHIEKSVSATHTVKLDVTAPTESWALTLGYTAKAVASYDTDVFLTMWWSGSGESSKGYLVQGANPMNSDGIKHLKYLKWDRASAAQELRMLTSAFQTHFLTEASWANPTDASKLGGDRAHYARASFNKDSNVLSAQSIEIRRNIAGNAFVCVRTMAGGTVGEQLSGYRSYGGSLIYTNSVSDTTLDGTNMEGLVNVVDSKETAVGEGTYDVAPATLPNNFDYSCSDINGAAQASQPFENDTVNFNLDPASVFPN